MNSNRKEGNCNQLIPGLPDDCAFQCLIRVSHKCMTSMRGVCKRWRGMLLDKNSLFYKERISKNLTQPSFFLIPALHFGTHEKCYSFGCVPYKSDIFILGGDLNGTASEFWIVDTINRKVRKGPDMLHRHERFACAVLDDRLYVIGGIWRDNRYSPYQFMTEAEYYDFSSQSWNPVCAMPFSLAHPICYADSSSSPPKLYVAGFTGIQQTLLCYCPMSVSWTEIRDHIMAKYQLNSIEYPWGWRWSTGNVTLKKDVFKYTVNGEPSLELSSELRVSVDFVDALLEPGINIIQRSYPGPLFLNRGGASEGAFFGRCASTSSLKLRGLDQHLVLDMVATDPMIKCLEDIFFKADRTKQYENFNCTLAIVVY